MRILGIDYGDTRVGLAITDELCITAQGLETITNISDKKLLGRLEEIVSLYNISTIVIGMPLYLDGGEGARVQVTKDFIHKLKCKFNKINIETIDERLTTVEAHKTMNFLNINKKDKKNVVDTLAATYILETYLQKQFG